MEELERKLNRRDSTTRIPYPEWDALFGEYRPDFVTVREPRRKPPASNSVARRRLDLEMWFAQPIDRSWHGRLANGCDVDIDAVVDSQLDVLCGQPPSPHLYRNQIRADRDVMCALLIDQSGSLAHAELLTHELQCADALVDAMAHAGETHASSPSGGTPAIMWRSKCSATSTTPSADARAIIHRNPLDTRGWEQRFVTSRRG